jgi:hypothetical protein
VKRLIVLVVVVAACAKKGGDCAASRLSAQHAIAIAKREAVHAHERIAAAGSNAADPAALAAIVAREQLLDAWAIAVMQPHPDPIAADAGGSDAPASLVTARMTPRDYVTCAAN